MKRVFVILLTLCLFFPAFGQGGMGPGPGVKSYAANGNFGQIVQTKTAASGGDATSISATFDSSVTAGNLIVAIHFTGDADSQAGTGLTEAVANTDGVQSDQAAIYFRVVQGGDGTTWGCASANADQHVLIITEIRGPFAASPLDVTATDAAEDSPSTKSSGTTATTTQNDEIAIAAFSYRGNQVTTFPNISAWTNSFVEVTEAMDGTVAANSLKAIGAATRTLTATGTQETTATFTDSPNRAMGLIATFKKGT